MADCNVLQVGEPCAVYESTVGMSSDLVFTAVAVTPQCTILYLPTFFSLGSEWVH